MHRAANRTNTQAVHNEEARQRFWTLYFGVVADQNNGPAVPEQASLRAQVIDGPAQPEVEYGVPARELHQLIAVVV